MNEIILPQPRREGGKPLMDVLSGRRSSRDYTAEELDLQTLSDLLWAAFGPVSPKRRTAPSSHNRQEIDLYVVLKSGVFIYDAYENVLRPHLEGDFRALTGVQEFVAGAPLNVVMVADTTKITGKTPQGVIETIYADTGFISQNIYLYCTSAGLAGVIRALIDKEALAAALGLSETQVITLIHTVGVPAPRK